MRSSDVRSIFQSKAFGDWKKGRESEHKVALASIERLDVLIKAVGNLAKVMAR
jgi:phage tail tube protein FII